MKAKRYKPVEEEIDIEIESLYPVFIGHDAKIDDESWWKDNPQTALFPKHDKYPCTGLKISNYESLNLEPGEKINVFGYFTAS